MSPSIPLNPPYDIPLKLTLLWSLDYRSHGHIAASSKQQRGFCDAQVLGLGVSWVRIAFLRKYACLPVAKDKTLPQYWIIKWKRKWKMTRTP